MQEKEISVFKCTGTTHAPRLHLNVHMCCKYWGCENRFSTTEIAWTQRNSFFFHHSFLASSQENNVTPEWRQTRNSLQAAEQNVLNAKSRAYRGSPEVVTSCFHVCGLH